MGDFCHSGGWFHLANQNRNMGGKCCSGIRQWNAMECFDRLDATGPLPYYCDVTGKNKNQLYGWDEGLIRHDATTCLSAAKRGQHLEPAKCDRAVRWEQIESFLPEETI